MFTIPLLSRAVDRSPGEEHQPSLHLIGSGGEHGLGREIICSLPRAVSCRLCRGENDCPYIIERPLGRLVVRKREPQSLVVRDLMHVATGSANSSEEHGSPGQRAIAVIAWMSVPALLAWLVLYHRPDWGVLILPAAVMLATFVITIVGVPVVRWLWRDHGGTRRGGAWHHS